MPNMQSGHRATPSVAMAFDANRPLPLTSERFNRLQDLFDKSFKAARIGIWECTLPDETLTWTDTVYEFFDLEPQAPLLRDATVALYTEESRLRLQELRSAAIRDGEGFSLDAQIITTRGNLRWIRITATVERIDGVPVRLFGIKQDITAEKTLFDHVRRLADTDPLTGLASRAKFESELEHAAAQAPATRKALLLVDLDGFKAVNDTFGHQTGDDCLKAAAQRIVKAVPGAMVAARLGGDEFAIIHECLAQEQLQGLCERIVARLEWRVGPASRSLAISASVGAVMITPGDLPKDIFAEADKALYAVKARGKNGYSLPLDESPTSAVA